MSLRRYRIPSTSALRAFEAAARRVNFSRAAAELHTSQSAISRHIANLEARLNTRLFDRYRKKRLVLTNQGEQLYRAVVTGFDHIQAAIDAIAGTPAADHVTIACTHEISHLMLLPRFDALQRGFGADKTISVMTYEYDTMREALDPRIDITIQHDVERIDPAHRVQIVREAVKPVVAPDFLAAHAALLERSPRAWLALPFLELSRRNYGWATWDDWLARCGGGIEPEFQYFNNYVYLLEAAALGRGLALGWRGLIERHLESGVLVELGLDYVEFDRGIHAVLTGHGRARPLARHCLACLSDLF